MKADQVQEIVKKFWLSKGLSQSNNSSNVFHSINSISKNIIGFTFDHDKEYTEFVMGFWLQKRIFDIEEKWEDDRHLIGLANQPPQMTFLYTSKGLIECDEEIIDVPRLLLYPDINVLSGDKIRDDLEKISSTVMHFFKKYDSLLTLDKYINQPILKYEELYHSINPYGLCFRKMIVSKMTSNPNHRSICEGMLLKIKEIKNDRIREGHLFIYDKLSNSFGSV